MNISYQLDGKDIAPAELAGKSGKVTIRFDYENHCTTWTARRRRSMSRLPR